MSNFLDVLFQLFIEREISARVGYFGEGY